MSIVLINLEMALILFLVTTATFLTFRLANFPDLSVDGVFAFGSAVFAQVVLLEAPLVISLCVAMIAGSIMGAITAGMSIKLKIHPLLGSVLILTILHTVNLRTLGRPNQPLYSLNDHWLASEGNLLICTGVIAYGVLSALLIFLKTELGCAFRASGSMQIFLTSIGRNPNTYRIITVSVAGGLVSLSGALLALKYRYADVGLGSGIVIIGIFSLIAGEKLLSTRSLSRQILAIAIGTAVYQLVVGFAYSVGVPPVDVKLITGGATIAMLAFGGTDFGKQPAT